MNKNQLHELVGIKYIDKLIEKAYKKDAKEVDKLLLTKEIDKLKKEKL
jgi:hypothetical protein